MRTHTINAYAGHQVAGESPGDTRFLRSRALGLLVLAFVIIAVCVATASAAFPGSDGRISFDGVVGNGTEIFTARPDGSDIRRLTSTPHSYSAFAEWSPDGKRIAFDSGRVNVDGRKHLEQTWLMNADGSGVTQLTRRGRFQVYPSWSPDGGSLAIAAEWGDYPTQAGIWIIPAFDSDGVTLEEARRVTAIEEPAEAGTSPLDEYVFDIEPQFSPDGSSIVFTRYKGRSCSAIHRVRVDGSGLERLTPWRLAASDPDWSPNGKTIAFGSGFGYGGPPVGPGNIYVMDADGGGRTRLTDRPPVQEGKGNKGVNKPVWSPSGTQIMYTRFSPEKAKLLAMNPDGSGKHVVIGGRFGMRHLPSNVDWGTHP